ncbi:TonB-dependent receptor domain-containing protein [Sphingomonas sp. CJ20]
MMNRQGKARRFGLAAMLMLGTATSAVSITQAHAQQSQATLRGKITEQGQPVQVQSVTATEISTNYRANGSVSADGTYQFASLRPGTYRLTIVTAAGTRNTDNFTLTVGQAAQLDIDLTAPQPAAGTPDAGVDGAAAGDEIIVTGSRIRTLEGGEVGATITQRLIDTLPQNNRNFLAFADLAPGVSLETGANGTVRVQGGAQASRSVNVFIDGVGQKDYVLKNGITGQDSSNGNPFPQSAIGEYRVISSNYKAEFDQVSSVAITAVTKSGTNEFHGDAFFDFTNQSLRSKTALESHNDSDKTKTQDMQFGVSLGGPIIQDKMHFFAAYEGKRNKVPVEVTPAAGRPISSYPAEYQDVFGSFNRKFNEDLYFGKIDIVPTDADLIELSGKYRKESGVNWNSGQTAESATTSNDVKEKRGLLRWQHTADSWVNDAKLSYEDVSWSPTPRSFGNGFIFQNNQQATLLQTGSSPSYQNKGQKGWTVQDDFTYTGFTGHAIKLGVKTKWVKLNSQQLNYTNPQFTYNVDYSATIPWRVQFGVPVAGVGDGTITSDNFQLGLYIQDDWDVTDRLTINAGLRWDYERTPSYLDYQTPSDLVRALSSANYPNLNNANYKISDYISTGKERKAFTGAFQPRIGFSYALDEARRFTVFGGYGRSYDRNQFDYVSQEQTSGAFRTLTYQFNNGDPQHSCAGANCVAWNTNYLTPAGLATLATSTTGGGREILLVNNDLKMPYSDQFSLGLRSKFGMWRPEIGYTHIESRNGFVWLLGNRRADGTFFAPGSTFGSQPWGFAPSGYGSIILGTNGLKTSADSAYVKIEKDYTPSSPWSVNFTYTYTEAQENRAFGEVYSLDYASIDDYPTLRSTGVSKHRVIFAGSADLPFGLTASTKIQLRSPQYVYGTTNAGGPQVIEGQNKRSFILGDWWAFRQVDFALSKSIPVRFLSEQSAIRVRVDVLNLFNTANYTSYNGDANSPNFGRLNGNYETGGYPPRTFKLSAGFSF